MTLQLSHIFLTEALTFITRPPFPPEFPASIQTRRGGLIGTRPIESFRQPNPLPDRFKIAGLGKLRILTQH
jgi:hypothetical protein